MSEFKDKGPEIIEAHEELVARIERSASSIRVLSATTVVVAMVLSASYAFQLVLPIFGTRMVTVDLADPANQALEVFVLVLGIIWLYIGARNLVFSYRLKAQIRGARAEEEELRKRISP